MSTDRRPLKVFFSLQIGLVIVFQVLASPAAKILGIIAGGETGCRSPEDFGLLWFGMVEFDEEDVDDGAQGRPDKRNQTGNPKEKLDAAASATRAEERKCI